MGSLGMGSYQCGKRRAEEKGPLHSSRDPSSGEGHQTHPAEADTPTGGAKTPESPSCLTSSIPRPAAPVSPCPGTAGILRSGVSPLSCT